MSPSGSAEIFFPLCFFFVLFFFPWFIILLAGFLQVSMGWLVVFPFGFRQTFQGLLFSGWFSSIFFNALLMFLSVFHGLVAFCW